MKRFLPLVPALAAGLSFVAAPGRADARLVLLTPPVTMAQALALPRVPAPRLTRPPSLVLPRLQPPPALRDVMPHSYMIYGLKSGPGGMACTDRNGRVMPIPFNPHVIMGPEQSLPYIYVLPRRAPLPAPKKLPRK